MIDLFTIRPNDARAIGALVDLLTEHCDTMQVEHFLTDLACWHRLTGQRHHAAQEDGRRELEQWQAFLNSFSPSPEVA